MERLLTVDIGNTNIAVGVFAGGRLEHRWQIAATADRTVDEYGALLHSLFCDKGLALESVSGAIACSVVPPLLPVWEETCRRYFGITTMVVGPGMRTGLPVRYDNAREVGADRIANAVAAIDLYRPPLIVVKFGTATTFCVIDEHPVYLGGVIAPGLRVSAEALFQQAARLPRVELVRPSCVIGRSTVSGLQSGIVYGWAGLVEGVVARIRQEHPLDYKVVATGALAELVQQETTIIEYVNPDLTMEGLRLLWGKNR